MKLRSQSSHYLTTRSGKRYTRLSQMKMKKMKKIKKINKPIKFNYYEMLENPKFKLVKEEELLKYG